YAFTSSYGVLVVNGSPWLDGNTIRGGNIETFGAGVSLRYFGMPVLTNNVIIGPLGYDFGAECVGLEIIGDYSPAGFPVVATNNTIYSGTCDTSVGVEAAVRLQYSDIDLINNLLATRTTT